MKDSRPVAIEIAFSPSGWGEIGLAIGGRSVVIGPISYGTDALGDFARFALAAAVGEACFACRFDGEPLESRLVGERPWPPHTTRQVSVRLLRFNNIYANLPDAKGKEYFNEPCDADLLARAALDAIRTLGPEGYKRWSFPYPYRVLAALEAALAEPPD